MSRQPKIVASDLANTGILLLEFIMAWLAPERLWPQLSSVFAFLSTRLRSSRLQHRGNGIQQVLETLNPGFTRASLERQIRAAEIEARFQLLREYRPGGWRPHLRLLGREHIEAALAKGHGAIMWMCPLTYVDLVVPKVFHEAGFDITRVSSHFHGFASVPPSKYGAKFLNPIRTSAESRYFSTRILIPLDGSLGYLRKIQRSLANNELVWIRANDEGQRIVAAPFLNGYIRLTTGPANLALSTGAALLPTFVRRHGPGVLDVIVEPTFEVESGRRSSSAVEDLVRQYAARLSLYVTCAPHLWTGWETFLRTSDPEPTTAKS